MDNNLILLSDSYKISHWKQYPPKTEKVYSYFESRGGEFSETVFFGLQYYLKKYLEGCRVSSDNIKEAKEVFQKHFGQDLFNEKAWQYICDKHGGKLPVSIKAVPEGSVVPVRNVLMTIENTDPNCYWLTNYLETLLVQAWYGCTVATLSREMKKYIKKYLNETADSDAGLGFKLHDFGFRGVSSVESAALGGAAHLVNFNGSDTLAGILCAMEYYQSDVCGFSIPASEHSTITSWGRENEVKAYENMLNQYSPDGLIACVSDSYDIFNACKNLWGGALREKILNRNGTLVVRPDSGYPPEIVVKVLNVLGEAFGFTVNSKGYKVLPPQIRVIQGDGVDYDMAEDVLFDVKTAGWSTDNLAFGMGGALLQKLNRDTQKFAFKCSSVTVDGVEKDVYKDPITDKGKQSKRGKLSLIKNGDCYITTSGQNGSIDQLVEVFRDGEILKTWTFDEIRERAKI